MTPDIAKSDVVMNVAGIHILLQINYILRTINILKRMAFLPFIIQLQYTKPNLKNIFVEKLEDVDEKRSCVHSKVALCPIFS